jgi:hypothetical protein
MSLRQTVLLVALLNLAYFGVEFGVAIAIGSVSLFADSVDFREDASTPDRRRARLERAEPRAARHGPRRGDPRAGGGDAVDGLAEIRGSRAAAPGAAHADRCRRLSRFCLPASAITAAA